MKKIFKKTPWFTVVPILYFIVVILFAATGCDKSDVPAKTGNYVSFTPCKQNELRSSELLSKADVEFTDKGVQITYYNFAVTCDFTDVNVTHTFTNGVLNITQQGSPNQANCICYTDVSYTIDGISKDEVNVIFINGVQVYCHNESNILQGTKWKLIGIGSLDKIAIQEIEPKDCAECYTLTFETDDTFSGRVTTNIILGSYEIDYETYAFHFINVGGTEALDVGDGELYHQFLWEVQSFMVKDAYLYLYHNDSNNYLKYKKVGGKNEN